MIHGMMKKRGVGHPLYVPRDDEKAWLDRTLATDRTVVTNQVGVKLI
jgi:hypothetical protein